MPGRPRAGIFTDDACLTAIERGWTREALAEHEGVSIAGINTRLSRARKARRRDPIRGSQTRQLLRTPGEPDVFAPLRAAIARLADLERQHA